MKKIRIMTGSTQTKPTRRIELKAIRPNVGIEVWYRTLLQNAVEKMHKSVAYWIQARYRHLPLAVDADPLELLKDQLETLFHQWDRDFDEQAQHWAAQFTNRSLNYVDAQFKTSLFSAGLTVKLPETKRFQTFLKATVYENVQLIKSIPEQYLSRVNVLVMESVSRGRDLNFLTKELQQQFDVTYRRAKLIALNQNNKATSQIKQQRMLELGLDKAVWRHSRAGKHPRISHVRADGTVFDLKKGLLIDGEWILPGELPNCRCFFSAVLGEIKNE